MLARLIAAVAVCGPLAHHSASACPAMMPPEPSLALAQTEIATNGALIIKRVPGRSPEGKAQLAPLDGDVAVSVDEVSLGSRFSLWRVKPTKRTTLSVGRVGTKPIATLTVVSPKGSLPAPTVKSVSSTLRGESERRDVPTLPEPFASSAASLRLKRALPDAAVLLVVYDMRGKEGFPIAALEVTPKQLEFTWTGGGKNCNGGTPVTASGSKLAFAWVDRFGRLSPRSQPATVKIAESQAN